jgi:hypothetical protein
LIVGVLVLGYGPLKQGALAALETAAPVAAGLTRGAPGIPPAAWQQSAAGARAEESTGGIVSVGAGAEPFQPQYTIAGDVELPVAFREWIFVGSAAGLAYGEPAQSRHADSPGTFTQVFLEPGAFRHFRATGEFPEGTTFALEMREPTSGVSIARDGWFAGRSHGVHLAVKDSNRGGWSYFNVDRDNVARRVRSTACSSCHVEHGAVDNVFVQFYPTLSDPPATSAAGASR